MDGTLEGEGGASNSRSVKPSTLVDRNRMKHLAVRAFSSGRISQREDNDPAPTGSNSVRTLGEEEHTGDSFYSAVPPLRFSPPRRRKLVVEASVERDKEKIRGDPYIGQIIFIIGT